MKNKIFHKNTSLKILMFLTLFSMHCNKHASSLTKLSQTARKATPIAMQAINISPMLSSSLGAQYTPTTSQQSTIVQHPSYPKYEHVDTYNYQSTKLTEDINKLIKESLTNSTSSEDETVKTKLKKLTFSIPQHSYQKNQVDHTPFNQQKRSFSTTANRDKYELIATAWHEAGHAIALVYNFNHSILDSASIKPGKSYRGYIQPISIEAKPSINKKRSSDRLNFNNEPIHLHPRHIADSHVASSEDQLPLSLENKIIILFAGAIAEYKYKTQHNLISPLSDITYSGINHSGFDYKDFHMPFDMNSFENFVKLSKTLYLGGGNSFSEKTDLGQAYSLISQYLNVPYESAERVLKKNPSQITIHIPDNEFDPNDPVNIVLSKIYTKANKFIDEYELEIAKVAKLLLKETVVHGDVIYEILQEHKPLFDNEEGPLPQNSNEAYINHRYSL